MDRSDTPKMAVIVSDRDYLERFLGYPGVGDLGFDIHGFTTPGSVTKFSKENRISVLLSDKESYDTEVSKIRSDVTVLLTEDPADGPEEGVVRVDMYQSVDGIVRDILKAASQLETGGGGGIKTVRSDCTVYTFFSPVSRCLKTTLSMAMAQILAQSQPSLYLNLEPDSGFSVIFNESYEADLSDVMFFFRNGGAERFRMRLRSILRDCRGAAYIPPVGEPADLAEIDSSEITALIDSIASLGYRSIVIDMGVFMPGFEEILERSDHIFMPTRKDDMSVAKTAQLYSYLRYTGRGELGDRIRVIEPPYFASIPPIPAGLVSSEPGLYAQALLEEAALPEAIHG